MSDNEPRERGEGFGASRPEGEAPRTRFGGGALGERPGGGDRPGGGRGPGGRGGPRRGGGGRFGGRRKVCGFCVDKIGEVDYKDTPRLRRYISERGKIEPRRKLGTCARHQRSLTIAIKRARHVALLPFTTASR
ncbi:MAG: ribosomal protein [Thermomicrobiales bacterium]|jgi:small subunit ribosomal protein S18|nr:ribosomal protein [Thermomicrobiales bacterium]